ncbi:NAD(P)-dependent oxidoreductase [Micrococcoides hystricis]|uniref:NAD(P)-dependent oxidoreductase n=1 Tax=Micrococcoides hystricis TaxID=1572761 RepID=A0ABV6P7V6_9MICC
MKITVLGATGMAGSAIVNEALTRGHQVVAASRHPATMNMNEKRLEIRAIDVADRDAVDSVLAAVDATVLSIRLAPGNENQLAALTRNALDAAARHSTRLLVVGGSAPLLSPSRPDRLLIDDPDYVPEAWKSIAQASLEQLRACKEHPYAKWVYVSPPAIFEPGRRTGSYQRGTTTLLTDTDGVSRITPPDFAAAMLDEIEQPSDDQHFTVAHGRPSWRADPALQFR